MRTTIGRRRCVYASMLLLLLLLFIVAGVWVSGRRDVFVVCCVLLAFAACADFSITFECSAAKVQIQSLLRLLLLRLGSLYTMNSKCRPVVDNRQMTAVLQLALHLLLLLLHICCLCTFIHIKCSPKMRQWMRAIDVLSAILKQRQEQQQQRSIDAAVEFARRRQR